MELLIWNIWTENSGDKYINRYGPACCAKTLSLNIVRISIDRLIFGVGVWWGSLSWLSAMAAVCVSTCGPPFHRALLRTPDLMGIRLISLVIDIRAN